MKESIRIWLVEQFGEDEELFNELYSQYAFDMKSIAAELDALCSAGDAATIGEKAHSMKGMALQIGDGETAELSRALQDAGRGGDVGACATIIPALKNAVAAL